MKQVGSHAQDMVPRLILGYLKAHPHAADSAEGIRRWWLGDWGAATTADEIEQALAQLVASGSIRRVRLADGTQLYAKGFE